MVGAEFNWFAFVIISFFTLISFRWIFKRPLREKLYFFSFVLFLWVYAGVGYGWDDCPQNYIWPYIIYMITLSFTCCITSRKSIYKNTSIIKDEKLTGILQKYGKPVIFVYIFICLMELAFTARIENLIHPPQADLLSQMNEITDGGSTKGGLFGALIYYIKNIIYVFYLVSLYIYKDKIIKFAFVLFVPLYITFAQSGYIGRGQIMMAAIIFYIIVFLRYPKQRNKIIVGTLSIVPLVMVFLFWYSMYRMGRDFDLGNINISDIMVSLTYSETCYPSHYADLCKWNYDSSLTKSYMTWLINLPLPGFFKLGSGDFSFNVIFSEKLLGGVRGMEGFYVKLPGIVNESIFLFGPTMNFVHAIILGVIFSKAYKLIRYDFELILLIHLGFSVAYQLGRAGTSASGVYPFYFKHFLIYLIIRFVIITMVKSKTRKQMAA